MPAKNHGHVAGHALRRVAPGQGPSTKHAPAKDVPAAQLGNYAVARMVTCPDCAAEPHNRCRTATGELRTTYHVSRVRLGRRYALACEAVAQDVAL